MKKLIVISVLLIAVIAAGIAEREWETGYFTRLAETLERTGVMLSESEEDEVNADASEELGNAIADWKSKEEILHIFVNSNVLSTLYERILQGKIYADGGQNTDARSVVDSAAYYARRLASDIQPFWHNIL